MKTYLLLLIVLVAGCNTQDKVTEDKKMNINIVAFETNMGNFEIELYPDKAPITVRNFIGYVNDGFYDGLIFHRVIDGFMVQGGGFTPDMEETVRIGTSPTPETLQFFYLDGGALHIIIPPYQAAAYAAGYFDISIPLSSLKDILK